MTKSKNITKYACIGKALRLIWNMDRRLLIDTVLIAVLDAALPYIGILLSAYVLDGLQQGMEMKQLILTAAAAVGGIFLLTVSKAYLNKCQKVHTEACTKKYDTLMSMKTIEMDFPLLDSPTVNEIRERIKNDNNWGAGLYSLIWQLPLLVGSLVSCLLSIALAFPLFLQPGIFSDITVWILLGVFAGVIAFHTRYVVKKNQEFWDLLTGKPKKKTNKKTSYAGFFTYGNQDYHHGKDIRIYNVKPLIQSKIDDETPKHLDWLQKVTRNQSKVGFSSGFSAGILQTFAYIFVVLRAAAGALSVGAVVKYAGIIYQFSQSISNLFEIADEYRRSAERQMSTLEYLDIKDVMKKGTLPIEKRGFCDGGDKNYLIEFKDVSFRYPSAENWALRHINMKFHIGERMAVVGMNGSGKTTFIKLLCRLYDPTEGTILLNGIDIRKYNYEEYMSIFSVVFQDFSLFSFRLGQNVAASVDYDRKKAKKCLKQAGFGERLSSLPKGLDTCLYKDFEEDGVEVSGGEAQKIAIARALYKDAPFIVLDEPTAALDPIAEAEIYSGFNEIVGDKTAIYISHRLSSCRFCDEIAVFDNGTIVQRGSHEELVKSNGKYHDLWYAQAQYYAEKN